MMLAMFYFVLFCFALKENSCDKVEILKMFCFFAKILVSAKI